MKTQYYWLLISGNGFKKIKFPLYKGYNKITSITAFSPKKGLKFDYPQLLFTQFAPKIINFLEFLRRKRNTEFELKLDEKWGVMMLCEQKWAEPRKGRGLKRRRKNAEKRAMVREKCREKWVIYQIFLCFLMKNGKQWRFGQGNGTKWVDFRCLAPWPRFGFLES